MRRDYVDPQQPMFRYNGIPAIGLAISMTKNADVLAFGEHMKERLARVTADLPVGIEAHLVADQPQVVEEAVGEFIKTLIEAIAIVLGVSFLSLGWRPGIVVAIAIPLVLAVTFVVMKLTGVSLQRISLGALIIGLGLLVDDAMIAVETMVSKLEQGADKVTAATFAYTSTAFPMLTGTLVTIAGFVPVGFAASSAGEYCFTLFAVVAIALTASWFVAVLFTPLTGVFILPDKLKGHGHEPSRFARAFQGVLDRVLRIKVLGDRHHGRAVRCGPRRHAVRAAAILPQLGPARAARRSHAAARLVDQCDAQGRRRLRKDPEDRPRYRALVVLRRQRRYSLLSAAGPAARQRLLRASRCCHQGLQSSPRRCRSGSSPRCIGRSSSRVMSRVNPLELGPPVGWPLKFRVSGPDPAKVRDFAQSFASLLGNTPSAQNINFDWNEPSKVVRVEVDQDRARALGISSQALSQTINAVLSGTTVTQVRDDIYLVDIVARAVPHERATLETLRSLMIETPGGQSVPLEQMAKLSYGLEPPLIWRRQRLPTITVQADTAPGVEAATVVKSLASEIAAFKSNLPAGYDVVPGGTVEESAKAQASVFAVFPLMLFLMITILMLQLQSFQRLFLVVATGPLAVIGVAAALLLSGAPMGFVAILGVISLIGMVIRNSVILIDQIETEIAGGRHPWDAVIVATQHRLRPILLTAAAAILGMIPIAPTVFWGPMAYAVIGGLVVATLLTLVFLPALYVAWFRVQPSHSVSASSSSELDHPLKGQRDR